MKKRVLSLLLALAMCLSLMPTALADDDAHIAAHEAAAEADEAVLAVQALIDALPEVENVTAEDYDAVQAAYEAYLALTPEQQAQITGAERFEALFAWFNAQVAPLDEAPEGGEPAAQAQSGSVSYVYAEENGVRQSASADCIYLTASDTDVVLPEDRSWYAVAGNVTINGDVTFMASPAHLILCNGAKLTINGTLKIMGQLNIYGQITNLAKQGNRGMLTIKGGDSCAIAADSANGATINFYGGTVCLSGSPNALQTETVGMVSGDGKSGQVGMYCAVGNYGSGEKQLLSTWQENLDFNAPAFYVDQEGQYHYGFEYTHIEDNETQHIAICKYCGYSEGGINADGSPLSAACDYTDADGFYSDETGHYEQCLCGNKSATGEAHVYTYTENGQTYNCILPTEDLQKHVSMCAVCGYENGTPESHTDYFDDTYTCTKCGFVRIATDNNSKMFNDLDEALHQGGDQVYICAKTKVGPEQVEGVDASVTFDPNDEEWKKTSAQSVELFTTGRVLYAPIRATLSVYSGTLTVTSTTDYPTTKIIQDGWAPSNGAPAVDLRRGGTLIFDNNLFASGGYRSNENAQCPAVMAIGGSLSFNGNVALEGGLSLTGGATLATKLKAGDRFYAKADSGKDVSNTKTLSIEGSTVYTSLSELLDDGCAFAYCDADGNLVDASGNAVTEAAVVNVKNLKSLTKNVVVVAHTHKFEYSHEEYTCECGAVCKHAKLDENYKCTSCGLQYVAECNGKYCDSLYTAIIVSINTGKPITVLANTAFGTSSPKMGNVELNLNGKTITGALSITGTKTTFRIKGAGTFKGDIEVYEGAALTLTGAGAIDGTINVRRDDSKLLLTDGWSGTVTNITVENAQLEMSSGTVSGVLAFEDCTVEQAKLLKITGGTFGKFGNTFSSGVTDKTGYATLQDLVADGYTLKKADGSYLTDEERAGFQILEEVTVVKCVHNFESGTCENCGAACPHETVDADGKCTVCGKQAMVARVGEKFFRSFSEALTESVDTKTTLVLLDNLQLGGNNNYIGSYGGNTIDFNGKKLTGVPFIASRTSATLTDSSAAKTGGCGSTLYIGGTCTITGGAYEMLVIQSTGKATLSDCTVYRRISGPDGSTVASYLKSGYAVYLVNENDNSATVVNAYVQALEEQTGGYHYEIREHKHSFGEKQDDGKYYCDCGFSCAHANIPESGDNAGLCPTCGTQFAAKVTDAKGNVTYYADGTGTWGNTVHGMVYALQNAPSGSTVKALTSGAYDVIITGGRTLTLDMNGTTNNGGIISIGKLKEAGGTGNTLTFTGNGKLVSYVSGETVYNTITVYADNKLIVDENWNGDLGKVGIYLANGDSNVEAQFSSGTFKEIGPKSWNAASTTAGSWLAEGYAFRHTDGEKAWVRYDTKLETEYAVSNNPLKNVEVVKCVHGYDTFENGRCVYCNYECPHETISATGKCLICGLEYAAKIGDTYYVTVYDAFKAAANGDTIKLLRNTSVGNNAGNYNLDTDGKTLTLDLNGFNIDNANLFAGSATNGKTEEELRGHAGTLKITGKGELLKNGGYGYLAARGYSTLDLSDWSGSTVRMIEANPNAKIILPTSSACTIQTFMLTGEATDGLLIWSPSAPRYSPTFGVIYRIGNESTVKLGDLLKNAPEGCAFYTGSDELAYDTEITADISKITNVTLTNCGHADANTDAVCDYCNAELLAKHESFDEDGDANTTYILRSEGIAKVGECVKDSGGVRQTLTMMRESEISEQRQVTLSNGKVPLTLTMGAYAEKENCDFQFTFDNIEVTVTDGAFGGTLTANSNATLNIESGKFGIVIFSGCAGEITGGTFERIKTSYPKAAIDYLAVGYAYQKLSGGIAVGDATSLSAVTVVTHEDNPDNDGLCACGRRFGAAMTVEGDTATHWYKTLVDAANAANQTEGTKTIKLYQDYSGNQQITLTNGPVTLDLNGKNIPYFVRAKGITLTVQGSGTIQNLHAVENDSHEQGTLIISDYNVNVSAVTVYDASTAKISNGSYEYLYLYSKTAKAELSGGRFNTIERNFTEPTLTSLLASGYAYRNKTGDSKGDWVTRAELEGKTLENVTVELAPVTVRIVNNEEAHTVAFGDVEGNSGAIWLELTPGASEGNSFTESITLQLYVDGKQVGNDKTVSTISTRPSINIAGMFANLSVGKYTDCHVDVTYRGYTTSTETFAVEVVPSEAALRATLHAELVGKDPKQYTPVGVDGCEYGTPLMVTAALYGTGTPLKTQSIATYGANAQPTEDYFVVLDEAGNEISERIAREPLFAETGSDGRLYYSAALHLTQTLSAGTHTLTVKYVSGTGTNTGDASAMLTVTVNQKKIVPTVELTIPEGGYVYDGTEKTPEVTVKDGNTVIPAENYTVAITDNTAAGTATVTVAAAESGNYSFTAEPKTFEIAQKPLDGLIQFSEDTLTYTGARQAPSFTASYMGNELVENTDYTVAYDQGETELLAKPRDAGDYTVVFTGKNNFSGEVRKNYTIHKATIMNVNVSQANKNTYTGAQQTGWSFTWQATTVNQQSWNVTFSERKDGEYVPIQDFKPSFIDADTYKVYYKVSAPNHEDVYGSFDATINPLNISKYYATTTVTLDSTELTYNGKEQTQTITSVKTVPISGSSRELDVTYEVEGNKGTNAGGYELTVTGTGNFTGSVTQKWSIAKKKILSTNLWCSKEGENPTYTGEPLTVKFVLTDSDTGLQLVEGRDYEIEYTNGHTNVGSVQVYFKELENGNYLFGNPAHTFQILPAALTDISVTADALVYNGEAQTPTVHASATAVNNQPVTFTYSAEENGTYTETVPSFTDAGTYKVYYKVSAPNHYEASGSFTVTVGKKSLTGAKITLGAELTYNGKEQTQTVAKVETSDGMTVTTFDVKGNTGTNADEYELTVTGTGNFEGSATMKWSIARKPLTDPTIEIAGGNVYTGSALTPTVTVKDGTTVIPESEYTVRYDDNTNAGTATVTLIDKTGGNYAVSGSKTFEIAKAKQTLTAGNIAATYGDTGVSAALSSSAFGAVRFAAATENDAQIVAVDAESGALTFLKSGTARVTITAAGDENHEPGSVTINVTVEKRAISITVKDAEMRSGRPMPVFEAVYGNFAAGESAETVFETPAVLTTEASGGKLGSFPITVQTLPTFKPGMEEKYTFGTPVNGTLLVKLTPDEDSKPGYPIEIDDTNDGTVEIEPKSASEGDTVNITVKPKPGFELDDLTVIDSKGDELPLRPNGDGSYRFTMPSGKVTVKVRFTEQEDSWFEDVAKDAYYYEAVKWAVKNGVTTGVSKTLFDPNGDCTRAQIVTFLWRTAGSPEPETRENPFTDVSASAYYYKAVLWAVENGITFGTSGTTFSPDDPCTRAQCVTFLHRWLGEPKAAESATFRDVPEQAYYAGAVAWAQEANVTGGIGANLFGSDNKCTRAQIVTFLWRAMQK